MPKHYIPNHKSAFLDPLKAKRDLRRRGADTRDHTHLGAANTHNPSPTISLLALAIQSKRDGAPRDHQAYDGGQGDVWRA